MKDFFIAMKFYFRILFLLCFFLMSCAQKEKQVKVPKAVRGLLDLSSLSIEEDTVVSLSGEWEFYWKQFCQPNYPHKKGELQCSSDKAAQLPVFLPLPSEWQNYGFPVRGFGTYRLRIILPKTYPSLSLFMTDVGTAYVIYLNGKLISSNGVPAKTRSESKPYMKHRYFDINSYLNHHRVGEEIELLIHVSNFHYANAGIWDKIQLISRKGEKKSRIHKMILDIVVFSSILIMGLYHLGLFFSRRKDYSPLYFGIFCILIALRTVSISERYILDVFPYMPFPLVHKIEYISFYYGCLTFLQFSRALFPVECPKKVYRLFFLTIVPFILSVIFLDMQAYTGTLQYMQIILLLEIIFLIYMITLAVLHKRLGAKLLSLGWLFFSIAIINDLLKSRSLVFTPYLSSYGLLILIVFQATVISRRFAYSFEKTEKLSFALKHKSDRLEETALELKKLTENLELKVQERTKDLEDSKSEIETLNQFTSLINSHSDLNVIFIEISKYVYEKFHITASCLLLPDENGENLQTFKAFSYDKLSEQKYQKLLNSKIPINSRGGIIYLIWKKQKPFYLSETSKLKKMNIAEELWTSLIGASFLAVPLCLKNQSIGLYGFSNLLKPMNLSKTDILAINSFCAHISGVIYNASLLRQTEEAKREIDKQRKQTEELNQLIKSLNEEVDLKEKTKKFSDYIFRTYKIKHYALYITSKDKKFIELLNANFPAHITKEDRQMIKNSLIPIDTEIGAHSFTFKYKKPFYIPNIRSERSIKNSTKEELFVIETCKWDSMLMLPLILQNEPIGILDFTKEGKMDLSRDEINKLSILAEQIAGIINSSNLFEQLQIEKEKVNKAREDAEKERDKSEKLLLNILPRDIVRELKQKGATEPVHYDSASVMFTDFKGFTGIAESLSPSELLKELDKYFIEFDRIIEKYNLEKLKTIGDSYMCAAGVPRSTKTHAKDCILAALEIQEYMLKTNVQKKEQGLEAWELRIGIHSGPLVAGVIGKKKFAYDLWGDTVNIASRMESSGYPGKINISGVTYELVKDFFDCEHRGEVAAKNKGMIQMYYVSNVKFRYS